MLPTLKNNAAADYQGPVKIELLKVAAGFTVNFYLFRSVDFSVASFKRYNNFKFRFPFANFEGEKGISFGRSVPV